ncbi:hypothetical protein HYH02_012985 [Chlamydomonas schloesseri]|uniref:MaoC-like domain-containing protein n=1 Tax=Chlamydomonas schloesseri TaxID=2026947 RepID=A0A835SSJ3_9CHLO|nr:hypothetical protein HYH02_012985 [Chlamydomonas schloesseri]|eukprot:KAG2432414.1 hypothetical protein HYH02_012985 [Chlamydomonas schloesseri]
MALALPQLSLAGAAGLLAALAVGLLGAALLLRPSGRAPVVLAAWPGLAWLYIQAIAAAAKGTPRKPRDAPAGGKAIQVMLARPVHFGHSRLRRYLGLAGFSEGTAGAVPLMYPVVEGFRLVIQCMVLPVFPFNVLGSVLARTRVVALRRVGAEEKLTYSCRVEPGYRTTAKGDTEVDLVLECRGAAPPAAAAAGGAAAPPGAAGSALVWRCVTTAIILSPRRNKGPKPAAGQEPAGAAADAAAAPTPLVIDTWKLGPDTGRRYGALNGDLNPIHLHALTSSLFGFKRPIAHALFLTGRAEASLRKAGLHPRYPLVLSADFKRPTLLPATLKCAWLGLAPGAATGAAAAGAGAAAPPSEAAVAAALGSAEGARFAVLTEDLGKEVLVGSVSCQPEAVKAALGEA